MNHRYVAKSGASLVWVSTTLCGPDDPSDNPRFLDPSGEDGGYPLPIVDLGWKGHK